MAAVSSKTEHVELVETHNLALSIKRLQSGSPSYDNERWKRALYHAVCMTVSNYSTKQKIREALELP